MIITKKKKTTHTHTDITNLLHYIIYIHYIDKFPKHKTFVSYLIGSLKFGISSTVTVTSAKLSVACDIVISKILCIHVIS